MSFQKRKIWINNRPTEFIFDTRSLVTKVQRLVGKKNLQLTGKSYVDANKNPTELASETVVEAWMENGRKSLS